MVKVKVEQGWLAGEELPIVSSCRKYYSFKGVPYAEPPVGALRFKAPRPPLPWEGVRDAKSHGNQCPQFDFLTEQTIIEGEDCLFLNVYSPNLKPKKLLPVMFFIHGGGFKSGSGNVSFYGPDFLVKNEVILVTINYRLEVLGFLSLGIEEVPGNAGLKDQVAALRWVKDNIKNFGGDPDNITVFGESAGGASVSFHLLSPMSKGLFKRAIVMSGVGICDWVIPFHPEKKAFILGKQLGLETDDPHELLKFLQAQPLENLLNVYPDVYSFEHLYPNFLKVYYFTPVYEKDFRQKRFLTEEPLVSLKNGRINDVDVLFGYTNEESLVALKAFEAFMIESYNRYPELVAPRKIVQNTPDTVLEVSRRIKDFYFKKPISVKEMREFITYFNDIFVKYDLHRFLSHWEAVSSNKKFLYQFSCSSSRNVFGNEGLKYGIKGASHLDDLLYLFDPKQFNMKIDKKSKEYQLIKLTCKLFTNFAKFGNPTPDNSFGVIWPEYDEATKARGNIEDSLRIDYTPDQEALDFWKGIHEFVGMDF